jgi:hypothetical protein
MYYLLLLDDQLLHPFLYFFLGRTKLVFLFGLFCLILVCYIGTNEQVFLGLPNLPIVQNPHAHGAEFTCPSHKNTLAPLCKVTCPLCKAISTHCAKSTCPLCKATCPLCKIHVPIVQIMNTSMFINLSDYAHAIVPGEVPVRVLGIEGGTWGSKS